MKKKILFLIFIIMVVIVGIIWINQIHGKERDVKMADLSLTLSIDKLVYKIGDKIEITYIIKNKGDKTVRLLPWGFEYVCNVLDVFDKTTKKSMKNLRLLIYELKFVPSIEDFILLGQNESFKKIFVGTITEETLQEWSSSSNQGSIMKVKGIFIKFNDSAILLENGLSDYVLKGKYKSNKTAIEKGKKLYNFNNIWEGSLESNETGFSLK